MAVLIASDLAKDISGTPLLRGVSLKLERRDRLTIAGRNGAGKTTLLRMLAGETSVDGGELVFAKGTKIALHDQRPPRDRDITLREYVQSANKELIAQEQRLQELEQAMATGDETVFDEYSRVQTEFDAAGGYTWRERATQTIHGLGFTDAALDRQLNTFSGGQLTRASLARALAGTPDLLLLDEPTNHLDIESLEWLEKTLLDLDAAIILVAHDRWFLETVGTAVLEVEAGRTRFFPGTWAQWRKETAAREMALGRAIDKQQKEIERMEKFVERFRAKATKAKQAQSRVKALNKIERISRDPRDTEALSFQFAKPERTGRVIFELEDGKVTIGGRTLLEHAELWLERGEHVTLVGANGTGKTTLIETLAGERELAGGKLRSGHNLKVGYLSQHGDTLGQGGARTVLEATIRQTGLTPNKARALLGRFLFSGEDAEKDLSGLSGGERQRVSLAILVSSGANVLILDEPTNHLDLESREALEDALSSFEGAVLLITHDRALLDAVGTRTVALEDQRLHSYIGGWPEYVRVREERKAAPKAKPAPAPKAKAQPPANGNGQPDVSKNEKKRLQTLERATEQAEAALAKLEEQLAAPDAWDTPDKSARNTERHTAAKRAVEEAYARWEAASA
ncbi:MAG: ABC-F family ATP-binding cassette domain-containing protein [Solirubrobacteraceae bacterium]